MYVSFGSPEDLVYLEERPDGNQATVRRVKAKDGKKHYQVGCWCKKCDLTKMFEETFPNDWDGALDVARSFLSSHGEVGLHV